jgi:hypothetical protein
MDMASLATFGKRIEFIKYKPGERNALKETNIISLHSGCHSRLYKIIKPFVIAFYQCGFTKARSDCPLRPIPKKPY